MNSLRIMSVVKGYPTQRPGGMLFVARDRAEALAAMGHDVHVVCAGPPTKSDVSALQYENGGMMVQDSRNLCIHYIDAKTCDYSDEFARGCEDRFGRLRPDVLHFDSFDRSRPWWSKLERSKQRIAVTMHGFGFGAWLTEWNRSRLGRQPVQAAEIGSLRLNDMFAEAKCLRDTFSTVIAISRHEWNMLADQYGVYRPKLVYNPIAPAFFTEPSKPLPSTPLFVSAAVGSHDYRLFDVAEKAAKQAGFEFRALSKVSRDVMPKVYDDATAVVVPSAYAQGYDLTIAEANARGRYAITSSTGSYLQDCSGRGGAIVCQLGNVDDFAQTMTHIAANRNMSPIGSLVDRHHPTRHAEEWLEAVY